LIENKNIQVTSGGVRGRDESSVHLFGRRPYAGSGFSERAPIVYKRSISPLRECLCLPKRLRKLRMTRSAKSPDRVNPGPPRKPSRIPLRKAAIHAFILFHLAAVVCWSFSSTHADAPLSRAVRARLSPYMVPALFSQQWDMFTNPPVSNNYLEAEVTFADGGHATWAFPRLDQGGYFQRYCNERYRKWATERVLEGGKPIPLVAEAAARYAARQVERPGNPAQKVELIRYRSQIPPPRRGQMRPHAEGPRDWERQFLYGCEFDPGGRTTRIWAATQPASTRPALTQPAGAGNATHEPSIGDGGAR
jgi:hypothetical protein